MLLISYKVFDWLRMIKLFHSFQLNWLLSMVV